MAWGSPAQKRVDSIGVDKNKHLILKAVHPSPLSATRGFFDCKHFIKANEWLRNKYGVEGEVEWDCLTEGKQRKGLPPKENVRNAELVAAKQGTDKKDSNGYAMSILQERVVVEDRTEGTTVEDAYEFDDEELDKLLSND